MSQRTGGCLCGQVRYRIDAEPVGSRVCWCRDCQRIAGNGTVNALFPTQTIEITAGSPAEFMRQADSGNVIRRRFCRACGSHLFADSSGRAGLTVVRVGTLDDPSSVAPGTNIWSSSAPGWAHLDPSLDRAEKQPASPPPPRPAG